MIKANLPWIEYLKPIMDQYKDGEPKPLDVDAVDDLCVLLRAKMNFYNENITEKEYDDACDNKDIFK